MEQNTPPTGETKKDDLFAAFEDSQEQSSAPSSSGQQKVKNHIATVIFRIVIAYAFISHKVYSSWYYLVGPPSDSIIVLV